MTASCEWATCKNPAVIAEDGWLFCRFHLYEHRLLMREAAAETYRRARAGAREGLTLTAAVVGLHSEGLTDEQIATRLKVAVGTVKKERHSVRLQSNHPPRGKSRAHGSHAGFNGHRARGEEPCEDCRIGERLYQRDRGRVRRAAAKAAA